MGAITHLTDETEAQREIVLLKAVQLLHWDSCIHLFIQQGFCGDNMPGLRKGLPYNVGASVK